MSDTNDETLRSYEAAVELYATASAGTVNAATRSWIDAALRDLGPDARILEIGSAHGREAAYIAERGFHVECTDAVAGFVDRLVAAGFDARVFNCLTDELAESYDLIIANAVLPHFTAEEFTHVVARLTAALKPSGRFAFSVKCGAGEEWSREKIERPRYFRYWERPELEAILSRTGVSTWRIDEIRTDRAHSRWAYVIAYAAG